jgi:ABC-type lipoprotein export system ATPase subunit
MIKLTNINKYFFKNRSNQNHVCNNINLEFDDIGLVVILGNSGSGKTTLLNVLSGMDKFNSGTLQIEDETFEKYSSKKWDILRKNRIGYIYQNYHLLKELSVYENIELVLKMYGITDEEEIENRIKYLLGAVGLLEYSDRLAKQLSGGQQQRIAFARALSKDPKIILADEPTGNLDSKTTLELMNILKTISETKLVIMVTHEQRLAEYYADRIIQVENGKIVKDEPNESKKDLALLQEQIIYLKDFNKVNVRNEELNVNRYNLFTDKTDFMNVDLIERNDTLYVNVKCDNPKKLKFINRESEIEVRNESSSDSYEVTPIKVEPIDNTGRQENQSAITLKDAFRYALRKINILSFGGKLLYFILALVGVIISVSVGMIGETYRVEQEVSNQNRNYITVTTDRIPYEDIIGLEELDGVEQVMLINEPARFYIQSEKYYEINSSIQLEALPVDIKFFDESKLIYGEMPDGYGIIIDKSVADKLIFEHDIRGITNYDDLLECNFKLQASGTDTDLPYDNAMYFPITGIADDNSESIWMAEELMYSLVTTTLIDYQILEEYFELTSGDFPSTYREVMLHDESKFIREGIIPYSIGITTGEYYISGTFKYTKDDTDYNFQSLIATTDEYIKHEYFASQYLYKSNYTFLLYSTKIEENIHTLKEMGYYADNSYLYEEEENRVLKFDENINIYILSIAGLVVAAVSIYFIMRSSIISRVYEVSVYRSLGASKGNIRKMFLMEILLATTFSSIIGYIIMTLLIIQAESSIAGGIHLVHYSVLTFFIGMFGLYGINIVFGLAPIDNLLRKTPAEIMKKFDL